jgi:hypothetical protein
LAGATLLSQNASTLAAEVAFRVGQRLTPTQITPYLNTGLSVISGSGSFFWDLKLTTATVAGNVGTLDLSTLTPVPDIGKGLAFANPNGLPILMSDADTATRASLNYKNVSSTIFNTWALVNGTNLPGVVQFLPLLAAGNVSIQVAYHGAPAPLDITNPAIVTPWTQDWLDDLVCDYAEFQIKRILNWAEWDALEKRFQAKMLDVIKTFSTQKASVGPTDERALSVADQTNVGRS